MSIGLRVDGALDEFGLENKGSLENEKSWYPIYAFHVTVQNVRERQTMRLTFDRRSRSAKSAGVTAFRWIKYVNKPVGDEVAASAVIVCPEEPRGEAENIIFRTTRPVPRNTQSYIAIRQRLLAKVGYMSARRNSYKGGKVYPLPFLSIPLLPSLPFFLPPLHSALPSTLWPSFSAAKRPLKSSYGGALYAAQRSPGRTRNLDTSWVSEACLVSAHAWGLETSDTQDRQ